MKNGICPKCNEKEFHIYTKKAIEVGIAISFWTSADIDYYICSNCGYIEHFVHQKSLLPKIAETFPRVKIS